MIMEIQKYLDVLGVTEEELKSKSRIHKYVFARQVIWFHLRGKFTTTKLASIFDRKHSTVIEAVSKIKGYVDINDKRTMQALRMLNEIDFSV